MTFSLLWLPDVLENAGLKVAVDDGWQTRGRGDVGEIRGVICHHTGTAGFKDRNMPTLNLLREGRRDKHGNIELAGPLAQLGLGRDGTYYVIAAGRANHAGGGVWQGFGEGNTTFIGIEAENSGLPQDFPWPEVQMDAYRRGVAAILRKIGRNADFCCGHKEYARPVGRKDDPSFDLNVFRTGVAAILNGSAPPPVIIPAAEPGGQQRPTLRRGMAHPLVLEIQRKLRVTPQAENFGPKTEAAVRSLQRTRGMVPDGIVGPKTWADLDAIP
jgi:hypothetical protein